MSADSLDRPDSTERATSPYGGVVGIVAGLAIVLGIGTMGFAFWSATQSQASIDALNIELEEARTDLVALEATIASGAELVNGVGDEQIAGIEEATATAIAEIDEATETASANMDRSSARAVADVSSAVTALTAASSDIKALERELQDTTDELEGTREWVGDLAHCLVLEAEGYRYSYWTTGSGLGMLGNRGTDLYVEQMSHCE